MQEHKFLRFSNFSVLWGILFCILATTTSFAECIVSNLYKSNSATTTSQVVGQSFVACETGDLENIRVLCPEAQSGITVSVYYGEGISPRLLGVLADIELRASANNDDWVTISLTELDIPMTREAVYTINFSPVSLIYRTSNGYSDGNMYIDGVAQNTDLFFQAQIIGAQALSTSLAAFTAEYQESTVVLEWQTLQPVKHAGYFLDRSKDEDIWTRIGSFQTAAELAVDPMSIQQNYIFRDSHVIPGKTYYYQLSHMLMNGDIQKDRTISITIPLQKKLIDMQPAFPNPFNPKTQIKYQLEHDSFVAVQVYDLLGHWIQTLKAQEQQAGLHQVYWDGTDHKESSAPSGIYIIRIKTENTMLAQKVFLMR